LQPKNGDLLLVWFAGEVVPPVDRRGDLVLRASPGDDRAGQGGVALERLLQGLLTRGREGGRVVCFLDVAPRGGAWPAGRVAAALAPALQHITDRWSNVTVLAMTGEGAAGAAVGGRGRLARAWLRAAERARGSLSLPACLREIRRDPELAGADLRVFGDLSPD